MKPFLYSAIYRRTHELLGKRRMNTILVLQVSTSTGTKVYWGQYLQMGNTPSGFHFLIVFERLVSSRFYFLYLLLLFTVIKLFLALSGGLWWYLYAAVFCVASLRRLSSTFD